MPKPKTNDSPTNDETEMAPEDYDISSVLRESNDASELSPVELTEEAAELLRQIEAERDEAIESRQRALADFANFQRRSVENERQAHTRGEAGVVKSLIPVLDDFDLALGQPPEKMTVEQLLGGVRIVRDSLHKALETHGVSTIEPETGDEFDPNRHEAMLKQPSADVEPNHVLAMLQVGYAIGDLVLRPAKVALADGAEEAPNPEPENKKDRKKQKKKKSDSLDFSDLDDLEL